MVARKLEGSLRHDYFSVQSIFNPPPEAMTTTYYLNAPPFSSVALFTSSQFKTIDEAVAEVYMHRLGGVLCFETRGWWLR